MQEILKGRKCLLSINIAKVGAVQNAVKIDTHIISPSGVVSCVANGYDELKKVVALIISGEQLNELGAYSIDLRLAFADSVIKIPTFAFAEVVEGVEPCYGISEVYVSIEGGEVVPSGSTTTIEFVNREEFEQLSKKVDELSSGGGGGSITIDTALSATSNNAIANSAVTKAVQAKQDKLTLTTKANGNIVIGNLAGQSKEFMPATPSGDPMHYAYETAGAEWNASTGYWELNEIDITNSEMKEIYNEAYLLTTEGLLTSWFNGSTQRTNICLCRWQARAAINTFGNCVNIEVATLGRQGYKASPTNLNYAFYPCKKLKKIITIIDCNNCTSFTAAFNGCYMLEEVRLDKLNKSISFADSPNLSTESILYMIENATATTAITITLHEDKYMSAMENDDIIHALDIYENVSIASA